MPAKPHIPLFYAHEFPEVRRVVDARVEILRQRNERAERDPEGTLFLPGEVFDPHAALQEERARRVAAKPP
jgi:hypothetical protein